MTIPVLDETVQIGDAGEEVNASWSDKLVNVQARPDRSGFYAPNAGRFVVCATDAPAAWKAIADAQSGGGASADTTALAAGMTALAAKKQLITVGTFTLNASIGASAVDFIDWLGIQCTIYTPDVSSSTPVVGLAGSRAAVTIAVTSTTLAQGTNQLTHTTTALPSALNPGDIVALTVQDLGWSTRPGENFAGEQMVVESVTSTTLTFKTPFRYTYPLSGKTFALYKYAFIDSPHVRGVKFVGPGVTGHPNAAGPGTNRERVLVLTCTKDALVEECVVNAPYAREGIAFYEYLHCVALRNRVHDVDDLAGTSGTYEGYGIRLQGGEGGRVLDTRGSGCRHIVEVNGGQSAYGLTGNQTRPISYDTLIKGVHGVKSWAACVGDHPGAVSTTFEDIYADGCSGAVFVRGRTAKVHRVRMVGGTHEQGPFSANQGNDHCITLGEQQRNTDGSANNQTHDGWCGTDVEIIDVQHDMTGNGGALASTSHTVCAVHPLVRAKIDLGGTVHPTGNGVLATGDYNVDNEFDGVVDLTSAFSGFGRAVALTPAAQSPTPATTGQYSSDNKISVKAINPRHTPIQISGSADVSAPSQRNEIELSVQGLGSGMTSSSAVIDLDGDPNGGVGRHGFTRVRDLECTAVARATAIDTSNATVTALAFAGINRFSDGAKIDGVNWLGSGQTRIPPTTGLATVTPTTADRSVLYLFKERGNGQTMSAVNLGCTAAGSNDGTAFGFRVGVFADDGSGEAPLLGAAPLLDSGLIAVGGATGNVNGSVSFVEPIGEYWLGVVMQYTAQPTTFPTLVSLANPVLMPPAGLISTGTTVNQARCWKQTGVTAALVALTSIAQDQSAHVLAGLQV